MKMLKVLSLSIFLTTVFSTYGQNKDKDVIVVNYTTNSVSDFLVNMLKKQITNPQEYSKILGQVSNYKIYNSLYYNLKTKESFYVLDSIHEVEGISISGHVKYTYKDSNNSIQGEEIFMKKDFDFQGNLEDLKWNITDEQQEINGYNCIKAVLEDYPDFYVWFTPEVPAGIGPYIYYGLPGLVLKANSFFQSISATSISYKNEEELNALMEKFESKEVNKNEIALKEVLTKKRNFKRIAEKGH